MAATFDSPIGSWNWTLGFNATHYVPSAKDLALAGPRMFMKLGNIFALPEAVDNIFGIRLGQSTIPAATGGLAASSIVEAATTAAAGAGNAAGRDALHAGQQILIEMEETATGMSSKFTMEGVRSIGNIFSYATSKWALGCIIVAVILNRTNVYARTRWNLNLPWKVRFLLRIFPIILLATQCRYLLQSIQCQTSPDFGMLRWGNASKHSDLMFTQDGGFLHDLSSTLLFGASDEASCLSVEMIPPYDDEEAVKSSPDGKLPPLELVGSLSRLWPLFKTFAFSQFVETLSCAVQGRQLNGETGMTFFEHSLAFAEAEGVVGNQLGPGYYGTAKIESIKDSTTVEAEKIAITRSMIMKKVNTTPEVLLVGFLSAMNHLTSHILAIFNLQNRFRLANTGFWGLAYMAAIVMSIWTFSIEDSPNQSLLRFPTVCIISFIPHVLVLCGIVGCGIIYGTALLLSALAPPAEDAHTEDEALRQYENTFMKRVMAAHRNMQANVPLASIRVSLSMDFYTALLRTGFSVMTMASEAVYLNESKGVSIKERTWLEEDRLRELENVGAQWLGPTFRLHDSDPNTSDGLNSNIGLVAVKDQPTDLLLKSSSGYAREMTAKKTTTATRGRERVAVGTGVGATERSGRWYMALEFCLAINRLLLMIMASGLLRGLTKVGIRSRPRWLVWLARSPKNTATVSKTADSSNPDALKFYLLSLDGKLEVPKDDHVDVEAELRRQIMNERPNWTHNEEESLDGSLYNWWLNGGWWGNSDNSGNFVPNQMELDEDATSVISFSSTTGEEHEWESDNDDGRRTPTQSSPQYSRESTPFNDTPLDHASLAQLLHPKTPQDRADAEALAAHLSSPQILTRSRYAIHTQRQRAAVLTSTRHRPPNFLPSSPTGKLTPDEEAQILEHLIISRRAFHSTIEGQPQTWAKGAQGMGEGGPTCVVCQSSPRSIIVWPCRCLSLCDDCRVTLAMNNFEKCVCCRRDVGSFSRIFVP